MSTRRLPVRGGRLRRAALALVVTGSAYPVIGGSRAAAEPSVSVLPLPFAATHFRAPSSRVAAAATSLLPFRGARAAGPVVALWGEDGAAALVVRDGPEVRVVPGGRAGRDLAALERARSEVPGARVAVSGALSAFYADPVRDVPHEALGSALHGRTLVVAERRPVPPSAEPKPVPVDTARVGAGPGAVFEDLEPRFADLDGDGVPEVLAIRATAKEGASLAVVSRTGAGDWSLAAETPPDGEPSRWLNPAFAGRVGGSGLVLLVRRPHLDGLLQLWRYEAGRLALVAERAGYSNHAFGETAQDPAAFLPGAAPGGAPRVALPTLDRAALAIVALDGRLTELARIPLPGRVRSGVAVLGNGTDPILLAGLEDGRVAVIRP